MKIFPNDYKTSLDFNTVLDLIADKVQHPRIKSLVSEILPFSNFNLINKSLNECFELQVLLKQGGFPNYSYIDLTEVLLLLNKEGSVLLEEDVADVKRASVLTNEILNFFNQNIHLEWLPKTASDVYLNTDLIKEINKILDSQHQVKSTASRDLEKTRRLLFEKTQETNRRFQSAVSKLKSQQILRDFEETVYKNRRVLAVQAEYKRSIKGIILSHSANHLTAYIEPQGTVKLNQEIDELIDDERREIFKILRKLTQFIKRYFDLIEKYDLFITELAILKSKARFANDIDGKVPRLINDQISDLVKAKHPLLTIQNNLTKKDVIPLTVKLDRDQKVIVISGPNAGGKSVALKTIGLLQILLQCGIPVSVDEKSTMGVFEKLFVDLGDSQSIEYELSTYSSKLQRLKTFIKESDKKSLFLIDEFGTGSDPDLGGVLAEAILEELLTKGPMGVVTTHYANIKKFADSADHVINANMQFDSVNLKPKYVLELGVPGSSYTFEVAHNSGLDESIIKNAKSKMNQSRLKFDELITQFSSKVDKTNAELKSLEDHKKEIEQQKLDVTTMAEELFFRLKTDKQKAVEREKLIQLGKFTDDALNRFDSNKNKKELLEKFLKKHHALQIKKFEAEKELLKPVKKNKKVKKKPIKIDPKLFKVGDKVRLKESNQTGEIVEIKKDRAELSFGFVKTSAPLIDLRPTLVK